MTSSADNLVMKRRIFLLTALIISVGLYGETFHFGLVSGDQYSIESVTVEDVYLNGQYLQSGRLTGKVSIEVESEEGEWTSNRGDFYILEEVTRGSETIFSLSETTTVYFKRNHLGDMEVDKEYLSPVMRNLPHLPEGEIAIGAEWTAIGEEVHDLSRNYDVLEVRFPIEVDYIYKGPVEYEGRDLDHFEMVYDIMYENDPEYVMGLFYPARVRGRSERTMLWDNDKGLPYQISEDFHIIFDMADGQEVVYTGVRSAVYTTHEELTEQAAEDVEEALSDLEDTEVELEKEGITITLHNIHFDPDSPILREEEKARLLEIVEVLDYYSDRDLLITGHAADIGDWDKGVLLSEQRSANTAAFIRESLENPDRLIMTRGVGAADPVATNSTEAGRVKNRRVEITILEN